MATTTPAPPIPSAHPCTPRTTLGLPPRPHGDRRRYNSTKHPCRCALCRRAAADYRKANRRRANPTAKTRTWTERAALYAAWVTEHGYHPAATDPAPGGPNWNLWWQKQRAAHAAGDLTPKQLAHLAVLGLNLDDEPRRLPRFGGHNPRDDDLWRRRLAQTVAWRDEHGKWPHPRSEGTEGAWLAHQRLFWRNGTLSAERVAALEAAGVTSNAKAAHAAARDARWAERLAAATAIARRDGAWPKQTQDGAGIGSWCAKQRLADARGNLRPERRAALVAAGFDFTRPGRWPATAATG